MNLTCPLCGGRMAVGRETCKPCDDQLVRDLADIPDLAYQLDLTETRQTRHGERGTGRPAETGLSWDERARTAHDQLRAVLIGWTTEIGIGPGPRPDAGYISIWLTVHRIHLLRHPAFDEAIWQIRQAVKQARWAIDLPADTWYAGPCNTPLKDDDGVETDQICETDLYARHGAAKVYCRTCRAEHEVAYRFGWAMGQAKDHLATATEIARALSGFGQGHLPASTIRWWAHKGRLTAKGTDGRGNPMYRIGDVLELLAGRDLHRGPTCVRRCVHGSCRDIRGEHGRMAG